MATPKSLLHKFCLDNIEARILTIRQSIHDSHASGLEETKSSAGDKYETGRAMMHLEMEKLSTQLAEAEKQKAALLQINPSVASETVQNGSLVFTSQGNYYLSVSAGVFTIDGKEYITLSSASPLGSKLFGLQRGHQIEWNKKSIAIEEVR
jgi:transcription elongation GreA/GreB family factor